MSNPQVLIAGAGPAGLIMALYLVQSGIKPRVIDKAANHRIGSRGFGIQPRTFELFHFLGLVEDVLKAAMPVPTMRAYKLPGGTEPVKTWDMYEKNEGTWPDRPYPNGACLSQSTLEEVMRKHLARYDIDIELNHELVGLEQTRESVTAIIVNHSSGACETVDFPYVIGADGAKGSSRKLLGLTFEGETRDADSMLWADVEIQGLTSDFWHCWGKPGQFTIMARPLDASADNHQFGVGVVGHNFDVSGLTEPEKLQEFIINETGRSDLDFGQFSWISYFRPNMRVVNKFHVGRVFLVGDAAHVHPPTGGQGMNCSIQDSSNLAWKLALVLKGRSPPSLLSTYDTERLPVTTQMLHATTQLYTHVVAKESQSVPSEPEVRDSGKESGWFRWRNNALFLFGVNYRFSVLVLEERDTHPQDHETARARAYQGYENMPSVLRAGDRAPDAPVLVSTIDGHSTSLFTLLRPYLHTIVVFPGENHPTDEILAVCREYPSGIVQTIVVSVVSVDGLNVPGFVDQNGHARRAYRARTDGTDVVIIRPDGFIGAIVCDANGLTRYFSKILHQVFS